MKILFALLIIFAATCLDALSASYYYSTRQTNGMLKPAQVYALQFRPKTLFPIPGSESSAQETTPQSSGTPRLNRTATDSTVGTRIVGIREGGDTFRLLFDLGEDQHNISINAYNLLGKKVVEIYQGSEKAGKGKDYNFNVSSLPNGIYICVVQGDNFRLAEKFVISR